MDQKKFYSLTTKRFTLRCRHYEWLERTQELYNEILLFYYRVYLQSSEAREATGMQVFRTMEKLTIAGKDRQPVPYPIPWKGVPQYFRRAAVNAAIAAGKSYLARVEQKTPAKQFHNATVYYKGMYRDFTEKEITLRLWNGEEWSWLRCKLSGNQLPENAQCLSPSVTLDGTVISLNVPVKTPVADGRRAGERMKEDSAICVVQLTGEDAVAVCLILDSHGNQKSVHFIKGGRQYENICRELFGKIERSRRATGGQVQGQANKRYWKKLKNVNHYFSNSISRQVINISIEKNAGIIVLPAYEEAYTHLVMSRTESWSPIHLASRIREQLGYKAWQAGKIVLEVHAADTSSCCARCGAPVCKKGELFVCANGHQGNRHINTARNLGRKCLSSFGKHAL